MTFFWYASTKSYRPPHPKGMKGGCSPQNKTSMQQLQILTRKRLAKVFQNRAQFRNILDAEINSRATQPMRIKRADR
jgi:hypothetical protein